MFHKFGLHGLITILCLALTVSQVFSQTSNQSQDLQNNAAIRKQALEFAYNNQHGNALPLFEKIYEFYKNDVEVVIFYGIALLTTSVTSKNPEERAKQKERAAVILRRAKELGTDNEIALHYLEGLENNADAIDSTFSENKEVENLMREGEAEFNKGEYDKAFILYEKAFKIDPKSYEAALFAGDTFYAQKKFAESESWFAKAAAINPNREQAFRFWADALLGQRKIPQAAEKFAEAVIAEPKSRLTWSSFENFASEHDQRTAPFFVMPPAVREGDNLRIDDSLLKQEDGTIHWKKFFEMRAVSQKREGENFVPVLAEDVKTFKNMAQSIRAEMKSGKISNLNPSLANLLKLDEIGMIDIYTLFYMHDAGDLDEYEIFRNKNRERMKRFFVDYVLGFKS